MIGSIVTPDFSVDAIIHMGYDDVADRDLVNKLKAMNPDPKKPLVVKLKKDKLEKFFKLLCAIELVEDKAYMVGNFTGDDEYNVWCDK